MLKVILKRHYTTQQLNAQEWAFPGGRDGLERFLSLPATWPLARLMFPIRDLVKQMETLLQTYCFEIAVTCAESSEQSAYVRRMALHLGQYWPSIWLRPSLDSYKKSSHTLLTQKLGPSHLHRAVVCLQPFQSGEREGATTATQWLGQGRLPPL